MTDPTYTVPPEWLAGARTSSVTSDLSRTPPAGRSRRRSVSLLTPVPGWVRDDLPRAKLVTHNVSGMANLFSPLAVAEIDAIGASPSER